MLCDLSFVHGTVLHLLSPSAVNFLFLFPSWIQHGLRHSGPAAESIWRLSQERRGNARLYVTACQYGCLCRGPALNPSYVPIARSLTDARGILPAKRGESIDKFSTAITRTFESHALTPDIAFNLH